MCLLYCCFIVAPEIIIPPVNTTVINGSASVLNCIVVSNPLPSISWFVASGVNLSLLSSTGLMLPFDQQGRINNSLVNNTALNSTTIYSSLRLMETTSFIAGEYACEASNVLQNISSTATLTVHGKLPITSTLLMCLMILVKLNSVWLNS